MSFERTIKSEENQLGCYLKKSDEKLLQGVKHIKILKFRESFKENL